MNLAEHGPFAVLAGIIVSLTVILLHKSKDANSNIKIEDLLLDERGGRLSPSRCVLAGAFILTSWGMIYMWLNHQMTETYFAAYLGAFVAPAVAVVMKGKSPGPPAAAPPA